MAFGERANVEKGVSKTGECEGCLRVEIWYAREPRLDELEAGYVACGVGSWCL
jgi:hypothetical protein